MVCCIEFWPLLSVLGGPVNERDLWAVESRSFGIFGTKWYSAVFSREKYKSVGRLLCYDFEEVTLFSILDFTFQ